MLLHKISSNRPSTLPKSFVLHSQASGKELQVVVFGKITVWSIDSCKTLELCSTFQELLAFWAKWPEGVRPEISSKFI